MALTNEDLLAFSQLLDVKLDSKIKPIEGRLQRMETDIQCIESNLTENIGPRLESVERNLAESISPRLESVESGLKRVESDLAKNIGPRLESVERNLTENISPRLESVEKNLTENISPRLITVENKLRRIEVDLLENSVVPRLNTIESCYMDTYNRYRDYTDKMEATFTDTELLKKVVSEHSEKIQKLA